MENIQNNINNAWKLLGDGTDMSEKIFPLVFFYNFENIKIMNKVIMSTYKISEQVIRI